MKGKLTLKTGKRIISFLLPALVLVNVSAQEFTIQKTLSDGAQRNTIAFDGLAFITGNFCACSFIPPGKVADFFGFQYLRDNDITHMGHNTDFNTVIANNLLCVLDNSDKQKLIDLAKAQVPMINQYALDRFALIDAFVRLRDKNLPLGKTELDSSAIKSYSAALYRLDGRISIQRADLYSEIINSLDAQQRQYLDSVAALGMANMPVLPLQIDKTGLNNSEFVAVMSFAGDIFSWLEGSLDADVYFCPERQGNYFGGFYIKDAPAMGNPGYSIDTSLTQHGGENFLATLNPTQASSITGLVPLQKPYLYSLVDRRTDISALLRNKLANTTVDSSTVLSLCEAYGELDGIISYYYATRFSEVNWTLSTNQRETLDSLRNLDDYPCNGAYIYSDPINNPVIPNTDFLFEEGTGTDDFSNRKIHMLECYPNPFLDQVTIKVSMKYEGNAIIRITDVCGRQIREFQLRNTGTGTQQVFWEESGINTAGIEPGLYYVQLITDKGRECIPVVRGNR